MSAPSLNELMRLAHNDLNGLCVMADRVRQETVGDWVYLRGLIEFSNYCRCNCYYCGLRKDNTEVTRYRLSDEEILAAAKNASQAGVDTVVLQSGEDPANSRERIALLVARIKGETDLKVTLSLGCRSTEAYRIWKKAGADRYLIKHETSDPELYARYHPSDSVENRVSTLYRLREVGFEIGTGFIIGLPGQTDEILMRDIKLVKELEVEMCGVGPFIPQHNTPLADCPAGTVERTLAAVAMLRITSPGLNLPATTALASLIPEQGHQLALKAGANVVMPNFTPAAQRANYQIYDNKTFVEIEKVRANITGIGRQCPMPETGLSG